MAPQPIVGGDPSAEAADLGVLAQPVIGIRRADARILVRLVHAD